MDKSVAVEDIKKGQKFKYVCDWDVFGGRIWSGPFEASDDAIVIKGRVFVPFGGPEGQCFTANVSSRVEICND